VVLWGVDLVEQGDCKVGVRDSAGRLSRCSAVSAGAFRVGVIKEFSDKKRNRLWQAPEVLSALDGFAARAGRRG
jgi:hypothetical protein